MTYYSKENTVKIPFVLSGIVIMSALAACGGGGSGSGPQFAGSEGITPTPTTPTTPTTPMPPPDPLKITTSFAITKTDYYPLDARLSRSGDDPNCCWSMEEAESDIASREHVLAFLREHTYILDLDPGGRHTGFISIHASPPVIRFVDDTTPEARRATIRAMDNINAWLPWNKHITVGPDLSAKASEFVKRPDDYHDWTAEYEKEWEEFVSERGVNGITAYLGHDFKGAAGGNAGTNSIRIDQTLSQHVSTIQHELLHSMGLSGGRACIEKFGENCHDMSADHYLTYNHVPVAQFPESEMAYASPYDNTHGLSQIDGETIQVLYTSPLRSKGVSGGRVGRTSFAVRESEIAFPEEVLSAQNLGPWDDTVVRYNGNIENSPHHYDSLQPAFGVDWRNGMARPWTVGGLSYGTFAESGLSGTASWNGELVGFTPAREVVHGDSAIDVDLADMTGNAAFTALEHWNAGAPPGQRGSGMQWHDGDLHYSLALDGSYFRSNRGDEGYVSGRFVGPEHNGAVGILERPDLTGAFGAVRK